MFSISLETLPMESSIKRGFKTPFVCLFFIHAGLFGMKKTIQKVHGMFDRPVDSCRGGGGVAWWSTIVLF